MARFHKLLYQHCSEIVVLGVVVLQGRKGLQIKVRSNDKSGAVQAHI